MLERMATGVLQDTKPENAESMSHEETMEH